MELCQIRLGESFKRKGLRGLCYITVLIRCSQKAVSCFVIVNKGFGMAPPFALQWCSALKTKSDVL